MLSPLLNQPQRKHWNLFFPFALLLFVSVLVCIRSLFPFQQQSTDTEKDLGAGEILTAQEWGPHLDTYFAIGSLVTKYFHANAYIGKVSPEVEMSNCDDTIRCVAYCNSLIHLARSRASSSADNEEAPPLQAFQASLPKYCRKEGKSEDEEKCWDTSIMRCWNEYGGNQVFDGYREWTLLRHFQGDGTTEVKWMHLFHDDWDLLYFSWGHIRPIEKICEQMKLQTDLMELSRTIFESKNVLIAGHSEGSGWAVCFNELLAERKFPHDRLLIASGTLVSSEKLMQSIGDYSKRHSLFLLVQNRLPEYSLGGGLMPDVYNCISAVEGPTFPSFGFSCDEYDKCLEFQAPIDVAAGVQRAEILYDNLMTKGSLTTVLQNVHDFENYRRCYKACKKSFAETPDFNFQANTPSYFNRPPKTLELPHCNFC